jgi:hypothetical protein
MTRGRSTIMGFGADAGITGFGSRRFSNFGSV